jgi:hypothetical protein
MTVYFDKVRKQWRYDFELDGHRHVGRCPPNVKSRRAAQAIEDDARLKAKNEPKLPRATDLTFIKVITDLSEAWRLEPQWENKQRYVRELVAFFKPETPIREIDEARIQDYLTFAQQQPVMIWTGGSSDRQKAILVDGQPIHSHPSRSFRQSLQNTRSNHRREIH